jgi:hypothetical protein
MARRQLPESDAYKKQGTPSAYPAEPMNALEAKQYGDEETACLSTGRIGRTFRRLLAA